jgi:hypothetical protein
MCAVSRKQKVFRVLRLREAHDAKQNFEPFRSVEACDWMYAPRLEVLRRTGRVERIMRHGWRPRGIQEA